MMRVVPKTGYVTTDGRFFEVQQEANRHQELLDEKEIAEDFVQEVRKKTGFLIPIESDLIKSLKKDPNIFYDILLKHYFKDKVDKDKTRTGL